jgi:ABC-type Na+ efflux pump permease subunit
MKTLRSAWFVARKDVHYLLLKRETILWTFLMPIVFFFFIGTITSGFGDDETVAEPIALRTPASAGFLADEVTRRLEQSGFTLVRPASDEEFQSHERRLTVPEHFTDSVLAGAQGRLEFRRTEGGIRTDYDVFRVQRAAYGVLADVIVSREEHGEVTPASVAEIAAAPRNVRLDVKPAGERKEIPTGFSQAIPGTMVMFTLLVLLTSAATLLVVERREGLLRRLASAPVSRGGVVLGKWTGRMIFAVVQVGFAMLAGSVLFRMDWGGSVAMVAVVMIAYCGFNAALGLVLGSLARTEGQAVGIGVLSANILAALGGCWWPIEVTPDWMQRFALLLPTGIAMDAIHKLVNFQLAPVTVVPHALVLSAAGLALGWLATRVFRFE